MNEFAKLFEPDTNTSVVKWCEENLQLSGRITSEPGQYSTFNTPYVREPLEKLGDTKTKTVVLCWGSQTAKTTTVYAWLGYRIANNPAPALYVMPSENMARSFSETRLQPLIDECPELAAYKPADRHKYKNLEMQLSSMTINLVGSNSPANISSRPIEIAILDEVDKFAEASSKEASAVNLALERTKRFPNRKHVITSTPTVPHGTIWQEYLLGDRRIYHVPCPHCDEMQTLDFAQIKWDESARKEDGWNYKEVYQTTYYECKHCSGKIDDSHKSLMLRNGEWRPTQESGEMGRVSYQLNSIYSSSLMFGDVAVKFLQEKTYLHGIQNFINSWLAEPFEDQFAEQSKFEPNSGKRKFQGIDNEIGRIMAVDVQQDHFWYVCRSYDKMGNSVLVDEGKVSSWEDIYELTRSLDIATKYVFIDSGYGTQEVYTQCLSMGYTPLKGEERKEMYHHKTKGHRIYSSIQRIQCYNKQVRGKVPLVKFSSQHAQDLLSWCMSNDYVKWEVPDNVSENYKIQINSHKKVTRVNSVTGKHEYKWIKVARSSQDHLWDCETMLVVAAAIGGLLSTYNET